MEVRKINRILYMVVLVKILGGLLTHSNTMIISSVLELFLIINSKVAMIKKENNRSSRVFTILIAFIMILSSIILVMYSLKNINIVSAWVILFSVIIMVVKYMIGCFYTNISLRKKSGLLSYGNTNSTIDFISFAIFIVSMILTKCSKWLRILKYADVFCTVLIASYIVYKAVKIINRSFQTKDEEQINQVMNSYKNEIVARKEIKKLENLSISYYGGLSYIRCGIILTEGVSMIDVNTFVITLQDYLLKISDVVKIYLVDPNKKPKHIKVRSLKEDARNSRSRNSKTNSKKKILRKKIKNVSVLYERMIESDIEEFKNNLIGLEFNDILRKGKWLLFDVGDFYLCSHLRMEGKYFIKDSAEEINKHEHVVFTFEDNIDLRYHDTRKFGRMNLVLKKDIDSVEGIRKQGIEPIDSKLNKHYLFEQLKKRRLPMKTLLLDQTIISGLGNIYADEVLFAAKINPLKTGNSITLEECQRIVESSKKIIEEAIKCGGTTIKSYTSSLGVTGRFQQFLSVHKRENKECNNCNTKIKRIVVGGRSTYYCDNCQQ